MDQQEIIAGIESRAAKLGLSVSKLCEIAGIYPSTFSRWKLSEKNPEPIGATIKSLHALTTALDELERKEAA